MPDGSSTTHLYRPKLVTVLDEGYGLTAFRRDATSALTVAVVALPLSMAIAVASGVGPERGLYTAIIGGFLSFGARWKPVSDWRPGRRIHSPRCVNRRGVRNRGLLITVMLSGLMLTIIGALRVGALIRYIPHAVTVGFTCGIAVTILASQLRDLAGLTLAGAEPGPLLSKLTALFSAIPTLNPDALVVGVGSAALIFLLRWWRPSWPGMLLAVVLASVIVWVLGLPVETIGSHFGGIRTACRYPDFLRSHPIESWRFCRQPYRLRCSVASRAFYPRRWPTV